MKKQIEIILNQYDLSYGFVSVAEYIEKRNKKKGFTIDHSFLNDYKTIVTLSIPYPKKEVKWKGKGFGLLSRYSYGIDYHIVVKEVVDNIIEQLNSIGIKGTGSVDISKINERDAAFYSNLGFLGKNDFLIHKDYGTYSYLATILIDQEVNKYEVVLDSCGNCNLCITACPGDALEGGFQIDKCISTISQEKKPFSLTDIKYFKTMIYGCDICQKVCPKNNGIDIHKYDGFEPSGIENVDLEKLLQMSNKEYYQMYGNNASSWKGPLVIKRNALAMLYNHKRRDLLPLIKEVHHKYKDVLWYNKTSQQIIDLLESE